MKILALVTEAFGGRGGIAQYNRDFLTSLSLFDECEEIVVIPRLISENCDTLPSKLICKTKAAKGKIAFVGTVFKEIFSKNKYDVIICGHINLLPLAYLLHLRTKAPLLLMLFGIDVWKPHKNRIIRLLIQHVDFFISISEITKQKFTAWSNVDEDKIGILPNAINLEHYLPGPKNKVLINRYGLEGKTVLLTIARLSANERYKGIDEIIEAFPALCTKYNNLIYLIAGDGNDRCRLEQKTERLGLRDKVIFTGYIPESEKVDHYKLADVFVMPSRGEGFGFVFLEAMACGIPVVASKVDGSREAVMDGKLGIIVNPEDNDELVKGILAALKKERGIVPKGLEAFSFNKFTEKLYSIMEDKNFLWRKSK